MKTASAASIALSASRGQAILCVDTCSILDVLRGLARDDIRDHDRQEALNLVKAAEAGRLVSVLAEQVVREFNDNVVSVQDEARTQLLKFRRGIERAEKVAAVFDPSRISADLAYLDAHAGHALAVVRRWLNVSFVVTQKSEISRRAGTRVNLARTPGGEAKQSFKDCVVTETYLDLVTDLRGAGITAPVAFLSSNKTDYCGKTGSTVKPDLGAQLSTLSMEFHLNPGSARHQLGL